MAGPEDWEGAGGGAGAGAAAAAGYACARVNISSTRSWPGPLPADFLVDLVDFLGARGAVGPEDLEEVMVVATAAEDEAAEDEAAEDEAAEDEDLGYDGLHWTPWRVPGPKV